MPLHARFTTTLEVVLAVRVTVKTMRVGAGLGSRGVRRGDRDRGRRVVVRDRARRARRRARRCSRFRSRSPPRRSRPTPAVVSSTGVIVIVAVVDAGRERDLQVVRRERSAGDGDRVVGAVGRGAAPGQVDVTGLFGFTDARDREDDRIGALLGAGGVRRRDRRSSRDASLSAIVPRRARRRAERVAGACVQRQDRRTRRSRASCRRRGVTVTVALAAAGARA